MNDMEFKKNLKKHNLTINQFLDLKDDWYRLEPEEQYALLTEDKNNEEADIFI